MIKALIVDDEKLVRKGIISVFPWEQYQFEIVGEAGNGKIALQMLQEQVIDLMFVDLTMPVMGGLELMKEAVERFPNIRIVVLTCHQDFNYIQEAMRLGAIDYIVKTQLDDNTIKDALERISTRILKEKNYRSLSQSGEADHDGYVLVGEDMAEFPFEFLEPKQVFKINNGIWFISSIESRDTYNQAQSYISNQEGWIWLEVHGLSEQTTSVFYSKLRTLVPLFLFYHLLPGQKTGVLPLNAFTSERMNGSEEWRTLEEKWLNLRWIYEDEDFADLIERTAYYMPEREKINHLMNGLLAPWLAVIQDEQLRKGLQQRDTFPLWNQWVSWLKSIRLHIQNDMKRHSYAGEVVVNLVRAIRYIQEADDYSFSRDELATKYFMSGSYFSQCFKDIVNKAYGEYLKEIRLNKADHFLRETNRPIYQIAELTGFQDEKYFSKVFRNHFGNNPQDYRKQWIVNNGEKV